jgi:hypothetical protein
MRFGLMLALLVSAAPAFAQSAAVVTGTVMDASGGVLPGAILDAVVAGCAVATTTAGADGRYELSVPDGVPFRIQARLQGFADQVIDFPACANG